MILLHQIGPRLYGSNFNEPEQIAACNEPISFDGVYTSIMAHTDILVGKDITLFPMGAYVGKDNSWDKGEPLSNFCTWNEIKWLAARLNAKVGFHSWTHPDLTLLSDDDAYREICPPVVPGLHFQFFAYPHGKVDDRIAALVRAAGYQDAYAAGPHGNGGAFQRRRSYLNW